MREPAAAAEMREHGGKGWAGDGPPQGSSQWLVRVPPDPLPDGGSTHSSSRTARRGIAAINLGWGVQWVQGVTQVEGFSQADAGAPTWIVLGHLRPFRGALGVCSNVRGQVLAQ